MLLLHLLLHVLIFHLLTAKEGPKEFEEELENEKLQRPNVPKDTNYIIRRIDQCPREGYFFNRGSAPNSLDPGPCILCFCQEDNTAVCWRRDNRRCNADSFLYHGVGKKDSTSSNKPAKRARRSFSDIFFRDASRDIFNRNTEDKQCKPYESSFSDDCPPADWCIGCTVCDCDANGRWDCHILSFCPENKKGKNKGKPNNARKVVKKKPVPATTANPKKVLYTVKKPPLRRAGSGKKTPAKKITKAVSLKNKHDGNKNKKPHAKNNNKSNPKSNAININNQQKNSKSKSISIGKTANKINNKSNNKQPKKGVPQNKKSTITYNKKIMPKNNSSNSVIIKKNISTHSPLYYADYSKNQRINQRNSTLLVAQQVVKKVMAAVRQMVQREMMNMTRVVTGVVQPQTPKINTTVKIPQVPKPQPIPKPKLMPRPKSKPRPKLPLSLSMPVPMYAAPMQNSMGMPGPMSMADVYEMPNMMPRFGPTGRMLSKRQIISPRMKYETIKTPWRRRDKRDISLTREINSSLVSSVVATQQDNRIKSTVITDSPTADSDKLMTGNQITDKSMPATNNNTGYFEYNTVATELAPLNQTFTDTTPTSTINVIKLNVVPLLNATNEHKIETNIVNLIEKKNDKRNLLDEIATNVLNKLAIRTDKQVNKIINNKFHERIKDNHDTSKGEPEIPMIKMSDKSTSDLNIKVPAIINVTIPGNTLQPLIISSDIQSDSNVFKYYNNWSHLKILKELELASKLSSTSKEMLNSLVDGVRPEEDTNRVHNEDVNRITETKKYNLVTFLAHRRCPYLNSVGKVLKDNRTNVETPNNNSSSLQYKLDDILKVYQNATNKMKKAKKFSLIKYMKNIFKNIFKRKNRVQKYSRNHIIETICHNFGPCKVNPNDKKLLKLKLTELDGEITTVLNTVNIIKGLLRLLDFPSKYNATLSVQQNFRNDMLKLSHIMKETYAASSKKALSETEVIQIKYIKKSTQDFVASISKFAKLLNEIIDISTKNNNVKCENKIATTKHKRDHIKSLKYLLLRYNLVENTFMKKMYELLNSLHIKNNNKPKVDVIPKLNHEEAFENHLKIIIENLRKLKHLAQVMNSTGRKKREAHDTDAVQYLLLLMEYLLKQNHRLDAAPANDGIDLLIEAIKVAPDIKSVRKKVLESLPSKLDRTNTVVGLSVTEDSHSINKYINNIPEDTPVYIAGTEATNVDISNNEDAVKKIAIDHKNVFEIMDDRDPIDTFQYDRRAELSKDHNYDFTQTDRTITSPELTTLITFSGDVFEDDKTESSNLEMNNNYNNNVLSESVILYDNFTESNTESILVDKIATKTSKPYDTKKFQPLYADDVDEENLPSAVPTIETASIVLRNEKMTGKPQVDKSYSDTNLDYYDSKKNNPGTAYKIEWVSENFEKEMKPQYDEEEVLNDRILKKKNDVVMKTAPDIKMPLPVRTTAPKTSPTTKDVSSLSSEIDEKAQKLKKINTEELMIKKQMDLLNSLDYGTERVDFEETELKNDNVEERDTDTFPAYFV